MWRHRTARGGDLPDSPPIHSCIDPQSYLRDVFLCLPQLPAERVAELFPDRWLAAHPEHRLEFRAAEAQSKAQSKRISRAKRRKALQRARAR